MTSYMELSAKTATAHQAPSQGMLANAFLQQAEPGIGHNKGPAIKPAYEVSPLTDYRARGSIISDNMVKVGFLEKSDGTMARFSPVEVKDATGRSQFVVGRFEKALTNGGVQFIDITREDQISGMGRTKTGAYFDLNQNRGPRRTL